MASSAPRTSDLRASLQRMQRYLRDALKDDWGANVFEEVLRHLEPVLADLDAHDAPDASVRRRVSALGAQLQASEGARIFAMTDDLEREVQILKPLLEAHLESLQVEGAA